MTTQTQRRSSSLPIFLLLITFLLLPTTVVSAEKAFGPSVGWESRNNSISVGLNFQYGFSSKFRINPQVGMVFRHNDKDAFFMNLNAHFPMTFRNGKGAFYPLAGLNFSSWNIHGKPADNLAEDVTTHRSRIGLNVGAGTEVYCSPTMKLFWEARYILIKTYPGANISMGIAYRF